MPHNLHDTFSASSTASSTPCRRLEGAGRRRSRACRFRSASCSSRCCATTTARRSPRSTASSSPAGSRRRQRTDEIPFVVARVAAAGLHRRAAARRSRRDARRGADAWARTRRSSSRWCRSIWSSTTRCRSTTTARRTRSTRTWKLEFTRNRERYEFLKWGMQAFDTFEIVPPGIGIVPPGQPRVLSRAACDTKDGMCYPDTLVGTDSHTTMINGLGVRRLGRGRHRGRSRHARPAGVLPRRRTSSACT